MINSKLRRSKRNLRSDQSGDDSTQEFITPVDVTMEDNLEGHSKGSSSLSPDEMQKSVVSSHTITNETESVTVHHGCDQMSTKSPIGSLSSRIPNQIRTEHGYGDMHEPRNPNAPGQDFQLQLLHMQQNFSQAIQTLTNTMQTSLARMTQQIQQHTGTPNRRSHVRPHQARNTCNSAIQDSDTSMDEGSVMSSVHTNPRIFRQNQSIKLPVYTGKESWKVFITRFTTVADNYQWSNQRRLIELLPRLGDRAGEIVFSELSEEVRTDYRKLISELNNRLMVVETSHTFKAQFSRRSQQSNESAEDFASDLKRLYDKGYPGRDTDTRKEDLLRRFLDGLHDEKCSWNVEYVRNPQTIDEAVFQVVDYQARGKFKRRNNPIREIETDSESDEDAPTGIRSARPPPKRGSRSLRPFSQEPKENKESLTRKETTSEWQEISQNLKTLNSKIDERMEKLEKSNANIIERINSDKEELKAMITKVEKKQDRITGTYRNLSKKETRT